MKHGIVLSILLDWSIKLAVKVDQDGKQNDIFLSITWLVFWCFVHISFGVHFLQKGNIGDNYIVYRDNSAGIEK